MGENNIQGLKNPRDPKKNLQDRSLEFFFFTTVQSPNHI